MARTNYQFETSPRKIEPDFSPRRKTTIEKTKRKNFEEKQKELKQKKRNYHKNIALIMGLFLIMLAVSYRNSLITEKFNELQNKKNELAAIEKANGQFEVNIEGNLNLNNVEKAANEKLGMQKLQNDQKVYVTLPKQDYTEATTKEIKENDETNWFQNWINSIFK